MSNGDRHVVIGAGPAGLTAAWELTRRGCDVMVLEADDTYVGGLSRTQVYRGNRFDLGGHRFYTKSPRIAELWRELLPDDLLQVPRISRIHYRGSYFPYPIDLGITLRRLGLRSSAAVSASYLRAIARPRRPEASFEDWIVNRFGRRLFDTFFKTYTEKVWGMPCSEISKDWAAQRIRGLSFSSAVREVIGHRRDDDGPKTLISSFTYPRLGPGQLWEQVRDAVLANGGEVVHGTRVVRLHRGPTGVTEVETHDGNRYPADHVYSTMPLRDLAGVLEPSAPATVREAGTALGFRDFLTVAVVVDHPAVFPDTWIYVHDPNVSVARIQNYRNWSADMVQDPTTTCLGMEYFCNRGDDLWEMDDSDLLRLAASELDALGLVDAERCIDGQVIRVPDAYPVYDHDYERHRLTIRRWLDESVPNLHPIGRGGLHNYNSQDHAMMTALLAVENVLDGADHDPWAVNTEEEYAETSSGRPGAGARLVPQRLMR